MRSITKRVASSVSYVGFVILAYGILTSLNWYQDFRNAHFPPSPSQT